MKHRIMTLGIVILWPALFVWACDQPAAPGSGDAAVGEPLALSFQSGSAVTACGEVMGVRVAIARGNETLSCEASWAPASISGPATSPGDDGAHMVADCLFTVSPGLWQILSVEAIDADGEVLPCCVAAYDPTAWVLPHHTTEISSEVTCALAGTEVLDIYGWLERPPVIVRLDISPSKFAVACAPTTLSVIARDPEGDELAYTWTVVSTPPEPGAYSLVSEGDHAIFVGTVAGSYEIEVTVYDLPHELSTSLRFPVHLTTTEPSCEEVEGCTYTQGYWKNHLPAWPVTTLVIGGHTYDSVELLAILRTPVGNDATYLLAHQLIAARLNLAAGASDTGLADALADADAFLTTYPVGSGVSDGELTAQASAIAEVLTAFNEGRLLVPHCDSL